MQYNIEQHKHKNKTLFNNKLTVVKKIIYVFVFLIIVGGIATLINNAGLLPIKDFLDIQEPIGDNEEITIESYMEEYPELKEIPNFKNINYGVYGSDASEEAIADEYKDKLISDGYYLKYQGTGTHDGSDFQYYGYLKGITAVGIVTTSDTEEKFDHETVVMYTTGFASDYIDILKWYQKN